MGVRSWEANLYSREQEWRERAEKAEADNARLREAIREIKARAASGRAEANVEGEWTSNDHFGVIENMCEAALTEGKNNE